jgi:hypothetical protein
MSDTGRPTAATGTAGMRAAGETAKLSLEATKRRATSHARNIGLIMLALGRHELDVWGDCSIPIITIIDERQPAHVLVEALAAMDAETAAGIVRQLRD